MAEQTKNLTNYQDTHITLLHNTIHRWSKREPDIQIISSEGCTIYTQRILLGFYSQLVRDVLDSLDPAEKPTISVPCSAATIKKLLTVLATGKAYSPDKTDLVEVAKAAKILDIHLRDWSIPDRIEVITIVKDEPDDNFGEIRPRRIRPRHRKIGNRRFRSRQETSSLKHAPFSKMISGNDGKRNVKAEPAEELETLDESTEDTIDQPTSNNDSTLDDLDDVLSKYNLLIAKTSEQQPSKSTLNRRTRSATPNKRGRGRPSVKPDPEKKTFDCEKCGKKLASKVSLKTHMYTHAGKTFKCDSCVKSYTLKPTLKMHVRKVHSNF